jgi:hypothetical protein
MNRSYVGTREGGVWSFPRHSASKGRYMQRYPLCPLSRKPVCMNVDAPSGDHCIRSVDPGFAVHAIPLAVHPFIFLAVEEDFRWCVDASMSSSQGGSSRVGNNQQA